MARTSKLVRAMTRIDTPAEIEARTAKAKALSLLRAEIYERYPVSFFETATPAEVEQAFAWQQSKLDAIDAAHCPPLG